MGEFGLLTRLMGDSGSALTPGGQDRAACWTPRILIRLHIAVEFGALVEQHGVDGVEAFDLGLRGQGNVLTCEVVQHSLREVLAQNLVVPVPPVSEPLCRASKVAQQGNF